MVWEKTLKKITDKTAYDAASLWVNKPMSLSLINNQINCVYRFEENNQGYYLRITHGEIRSPRELHAAIDFQHHLIINKAPVCEPKVSKMGRFLETVNQDGLDFLAHVCLEVPGQVMSFDHTEKDAYLAWGKSLALLHRASQTYEPKEHRFLTWKDLWGETSDYVKKEGQDIQDVYRRVDSWFHTHICTTSNFGLTHGDHRPGNVLYDGIQIHIIDFDEPVYHWYMADIAKPFLDLCDKPYNTWQPFFDWYIEGYRSILPITDDELRAINWFTQMKSLDIYLWCKNNWFEPTAPGGKPRDQWLSELQKMAMTPIFK